MSVNLEVVERTLLALLEEEDREIVYLCRAAGTRTSYPPEKVADPGGFLPAILCAANALWREASGLDLGLEVVPRHNTILGFAVTAIHSDHFVVVMLLIIEALRVCRREDCLVLNVLGEVGRDSNDLADRLIPVRKLVPAA